MQIHNLKSGHYKKSKIVGRGGKRGKTSGRGGKGQTARSGSSIRPGFEGGQMPLYRKLPHRGFNNYNFRTSYEVVNVGDFDKIDPSVTEIDTDVLVAAGLIRADSPLIKVLGDGEISRAVKVKAHRFSASAKAKIEKAGGEAIAV